MKIVNGTNLAINPAFSIKKWRRETAAFNPNSTGSKQFVTNTVSLHYMLLMDMPGKHTHGSSV